MPVRAAFFDVGDTLVEHWAPDRNAELARQALARHLGELPWLARLPGAQLEPALGAEGDEDVVCRQETLAWLRGWCERNAIELDGIDLDRVRRLACVPISEISVPAVGAFDALRWCADRGLRVVLVTNTLFRGDAEVLEDWRGFGLHDAIGGVVSSHSVGWRKPHPAIFRRALEIADVRPEEAFHVGDRLWEDVYGAKRLGMRAVWREVDESRFSHPQRRVPGAEPDLTIHELSELPAAAEAWL